MIHLCVFQLIDCSDFVKCLVLLLQTEIARDFHFEYSTPKKKTFGFRSPFDIEDANEFEEIEAPKAPLRKSVKSRLSGKNLGGISVALFGSTE